MITKPQSDADVARTISKLIPDSHQLDYDEDDITALIAQHVAARTKPLVEALESVANFSFADAFEQHHKTADVCAAWLPIKKGARQALAQEKVRHDDNT